MAVSRVGAPEQCTLAIKPGKVGEPHNSTRNVVYAEVLGNKRSVTEAQQEVSIIMEVPDISEWLDYDDLDREMELDEVVEDAGPDLVEETRRRVEARRRPQLARLSWPVPQEAVLPACTRGPTTCDQRPLSEYEMIREANIADMESEFLRIFGRPLNRNRAITLGVLEEEEGEEEK